jgi:AcrR family transcriptional regulator
MSRAARRADLLRTAAALVNERGIGALTIEALAEAAGVAKTLPYAYFDSKDDVLLALFDDVIGDIDHRIADAVATGGEFETIIRRSLDIWFEAVRSDGRLLEGLLDGRAFDGLAVAIRARDRTSHKLWHDVVVEHLDLIDSQAHVLAAVLNNSATGVVDLWVRRRGSKAELVDAFVVAALGAAEALRGARRRPM